MSEQPASANFGRLYLVPTPMVNLGDITVRAREVLERVPVVFAEDTRTTSKLFQLLGIQASLRANHAHNEHNALHGIVHHLQTGQDAALVSDAGMPGISDPGFLAVRECVREGIVVECLRGASALLIALVSSGLPCDRFVFEGFLPVKKGRATRIGELAGERPHHRALRIAVSHRQNLSAIGRGPGFRPPRRCVPRTHQIARRSAPRPT